MSPAFISASRVERAHGWVDRALRLSPLQSLARLRSARRLAVLAYHGIEDPERFRQHIRYLKRWMRPLSLDEALGAISGRSALPDHGVLVTFDDGDRSLVDLGATVLRESGVPAVACIVAGVVDNDRSFWWNEAARLWDAGGRTSVVVAEDRGSLVRSLKRVPDEHRRAALEDLRRSARRPIPGTEQLRGEELVRLERDGIEIANHTLSHPILTRCTDETVELEITSAHEALRDALGHPPRAFAYPNGDWDPRAAALLEELGYEVGFLFDHRLSSATPADSMKVSRLRVNSYTSPDRFQVIVSGLHPAIHHALGRP